MDHRGANWHERAIRDAVLAGDTPDAPTRTEFWKLKLPGKAAPDAIDPVKKPVK